MRAPRVTAGLLLALAADPARGAGPHIDPLNLSWDGSRLAVSYRVADGLSEEALERVRSGIPITFRHRAEVLRRRPVPLWPAKVASRTLIEATAAYDSLTRRFELRRTIERVQGATTAGDEQRTSTESEDEMRAWMTEFPETLVFDRQTSPREGRLRLRVESALGRRFVLLIFPTTVIVSAEQRLEP